MRKSTVALLLVGVCIFVLAALPGVARAEKTAHNSPPQEIVEAMSTKLVRGVANVATGWVEFPKQIVLTFQEDGVAKGIFIGPFKGVGMTLVRTLTGAIETVTFFLPAPGFYDPFFEPDYVWQSEQEENRKSLQETIDANNP